LFKAEKPQRVLAAGFLAWTLLALVQAGITKIGFVYYVLPMVPPFALLTGMEVRALRAAWFQQRRRIWGVLFAAALIAAVLVNSALVNGAVYRDFAAYALGQITYTEYLTGHLGTGKLHLRISEVAGYIRARTAPEEKVYYWGNAVQFYELAERRCASENIWPYYAGVFQPVEELFGAQTPYMVVERSEYYDPPPYLREYLAQGYVLEATIEQHEIYRYTESEKK
jgi:4-amino-4-deoxy-L-arabinose transferase-like glycosyltransferase